MRKIIRCLLGICIITILASACQSYDDISVMLGADVSSAKEISSEDSHGGFHGDGERYLIFTFEDDSFENTIKKDNTWHKLPVTDDAVTALLYGLETPEMTYGPYINQDIPEVSNGYYFFYDRHSDSVNPFDTSDVLARSSFNFTAAIYDADTDTLYYIELDT
jgi:hypothetical protein